MESAGVSNINNSRLLFNKVPIHAELLPTLPTCSSSTPNFSRISHFSSDIIPGAANNNALTTPMPYVQEVKTHFFNSKAKVFLKATGKELNLKEKYGNFS